MPGALRLSTMNAVLTNEVTQDMEVVATSFFFPRGLLGFEHVKKYSLTSKESEAPFSRLRMEEGNGLTLTGDAHHEPVPGLLSGFGQRGHGDVADPGCQ